MASPEFAPLSAGISYRDPYYHIRRFNGDHYVFECVLQGTGYVEFNGTLTRLTAGDAYILHPCTFHHYYSDHNDPWVKIWFNGQGNLIVICSVIISSASTAASGISGKAIT